MCTLHVTPYHCPSWKQNLAIHGIKVRISAIRHSQINPSERCMGASSKFCRIYCSWNHRKWGELLPYIERWFNNTVASSTGFAPLGLTFNLTSLNLTFFEKVALNCQMKPLFRNLRKRSRVYMQECKEKKKNWRGKKRRWNSRWNPELQDKVLLKIQPLSKAVVGKTYKFVRLYEGPYQITKFIPPST